MEHSDIYNSFVAPNPNQTIGCQELMKHGAYIHGGWLRRQSLRNRFKIFSWPQVYVVISGGCVYCYSSETAKKPASAFSLYGYDKVFRAGEVTEKEATWSFKLVHVNHEYRSYFFSASSEKEMVFWMKMLKQEMLRANGKLPRTQGDGKSSDTAVYQDGASMQSFGDYSEIESNIYEDSSLCVLPSNYTNKMEDDESDEEMDNVVTSRPDLQKERPPFPPPVPHRPSKDQTADDKSQMKAVASEFRQMKVNDSLKYDAPPNNQKAKSAVSKSPKSPKSPKGSESEEEKLPMRSRGNPDGSSLKKKDQQSHEADPDDFWSSIYFRGDKEKASEIMRKIADDGVYLVRVNDDDSMVLHVYGKEQSRKFQIWKEGKEFTLQKTSQARFKRVEDLIYHYYLKPLPSLDIMLTECYQYHPHYETLDLS